MKKTVIFFTLLIFLCSLYGVIISVNLDGTGDYASIQEGINASADGDTVLVYPGRYFEHINYNGKTIAVGSLNLTTGEEQYIHETIIDGSDNGSCVKVGSEEGEGTIIHGFTITNGAGDLTHPNQRSGGGILLNSASSLDVINCIITKNRASKGGGIFASLSHLYLAGTTISYNRSSRSYSGGLSTSQMWDVTFSEKNRCNIYNNYGYYANDVCNGGGGDYTVVVDTFTVLEPDLYYLMGFTDEMGFEFNELEYNIQHGYVEQVENDLYVAPYGDNANSGISAAEPLQFIAEALIRIQADENDPHTIHLAPGRYSSSENGQILPLHLKSYVSLEGAGMYDTIIDGEDFYNILYDFISRYGYSIKNLGIENSFSIIGEEPYSDNHCCHFSSFNNYPGHLLLENLRFAYCGDGTDPGLYNYNLISSTKSMDLNNIVIEENESRINGIKLYGSQFYNESTTNIVNTVMRNNANFEGLTYFGYENDNLNFINMEFTGNHYDNPGYIPGILDYVQCLTIIGPGNINIINCTISDNTSANDHGYVLAFYNTMNVYILNTIISGYPYYAIKRMLENGQDPQYMLIDHCLIEGGYDDIFGALFPVLIYGENLTHIPFFDENGEYPYYLAYNSPCIDSGTLDLPGGLELPEFDFMGNPRVLGNSIDMGAYEFNPYSHPVGVDDEMGIADFEYYPNPVRLHEGRGAVMINYTGKMDDNDYRIGIYNVKGQKVWESELWGGLEGIRWDCCDANGLKVAAGVYFLRLSRDGEYLSQGKLTVIK